MENNHLGLRDLVIDGLEYLDRRTEFWRQQQPIYSRKRDKYLRNIKPPITVPLGPSIRRGGTEGDQSEYVRQNLEEIEEALNEMRLEQGFEQASLWTTFVTENNSTIQLYLPFLDDLACYCE